MSAANYESSCIIQSITVLYTPLLSKDTITIRQMDIRLQILNEIERERKRGVGGKETDSYDVKCIVLRYAFCAYHCELPSSLDRK